MLKKITIVVLLIATAVSSIAVAAQAQSGDGSGTEVRITAKRLEDGRTEFALQQRDGDGWSNRIAPRNRFLPAVPPVGRWLVSSPVTIGAAMMAGEDQSGGEIEVRITAMRLEDGRTKVALQQRDGDGWSNRIAPRNRFVPAAPPVGRRLVSSPVTITTPMLVPTAMPTTLDLLRDNAEQFEYAIGKQGGALTFATVSEPLTFNLAIANDASSSGVLGYLFEGLTETSWLTDEVEPALAESWERSDDGLTWTFSLRRDVTWHDGEPFTAHDVDFTFNRIIYNHDIPASSRPAFHFRFLNEETGEWEEEPMTVKALDDYTVECVLPAPFAPFLRSMGTAIYPRHVLEKHVDDGTFVSTWDIDTDPAEIIGTGPFTIGSYDPGERVVMRRNPNYWLKDEAGNSLPYLDEVVHVIVPDFDAELAKFLSGESDSHGVLGEEFADLEPLQEEGNFTIHKRGPAFGTTFLGFNMNPGMDSNGEPYLAPEKLEWFRNKEFRQAVAHVIDKDTIIENVQHGLGYPQWSSVSPAAGDFHNPDVRRYEYDVDKANEILDGIGWTDTNGDGIREDSEGNEIEFSLVTNIGNSVRERVGTIVHQDMEKIGIKVDYQLVEFGDLVSQLTESYDWEAMIIGFTGGTDPYSGISFWHSGEGCIFGTPISLSQRRSGKPRSTGSISKAAVNWTTRSALGTTTALKRSLPRTCRSSTRRSPSG